MPTSKDPEKRKRDMTKAREGMARKRANGRDADGLTDKERAFTLHYVGAANRNGADAVLMAGYANGNRANARGYAYELLRREPVVREIERLTIERNERLRITADDVLRELLRLKVDVELCGKSAPAMRTRLDVLKTIGDHVDVGAFRRQVGLSSPSGGPIETVDLAALAKLSDEELETLERARAIIDRTHAGPDEYTDRSTATGGEGAPEEGA